jgi:hypothetical protein
VSELSPDALNWGSTTQTNRKAIVQLTIDSSESIDKILPAVGAMFGVEVQVTPSSTAVATGSSAQTQAEDKPSSRRRAATKRSPAKQSGSRSRARKNDDSALVREWARANGFRVADRGRISAEIRNAYRAA